MNNIPVILLVSERSGSNLLRTLIGKHKSICAPVSPHLMAEFYDSRKYYGDLRDSNNTKNLLQDMLLVANHPYHDWKLDERVISDNASTVHSVVRGVDAFYSAKTKQEGKIHYCSKGVHSFKYIDAFRAELPDVKFVHLVRDPRDHVASWMKRPIRLLTPYDAVMKWKEEQETFIDAVSTRELQAISIRYEDLITDTPGVMTKVLNYIGVEVDQNCFETDSENKESKRNPYWQNLSKPVMKDNKEKFRKELSEEDLLIVESITKNEMNFFGYKPVTQANWTPPSGYALTLQQRREQKALELQQNPKEQMDDLDDKRIAVNALRKERINAWEKANPSFTIKSVSKSANNSFVRNRLKYLSYAVLGKKITSGISKKVKG